MSSTNTAAIQQRFLKFRRALESGKLNPKQAMQALGYMIDAAADLRSADAANYAIQVGSKLFGDIPDTEASLLYYFLGNAWSVIRSLSSEEENTKWAWEQESLEQELLCFRKARQHPSFTALSSDYRARILTNTANLLDSIGRFVDACELYDQALIFLPNFGMALGSKGIALSSYARAHYDRGHMQVLFSQAHVLLKRAINMPLEGTAEQAFRHEMEAIEKIGINPEKHIKPLYKPHSLGHTKSEIGYRKWCLSNRLFLNPLNDIGPLEIASYDPLLLPSITTGRTKGPCPWVIGFFNQLKQEYASARYLLYEGMITSKAHFADRGTRLVNTLDYPVYGLGQDKVKLTFRMAYSLLDKVAFFMNHYFNLGLKEKNVSFNRVWHEEGDLGKGINPILACKKNRPLRGLFWLSRDIFEKDASFVEALEPDAKELKGLRDALEHKFVKVYEYRIADSIHEAPVFHIHRGDFNAKALRVLKVARASLIYLSFAVHREERDKNADKKQAEIVASMRLSLVDDRFKF